MPKNKGGGSGGKGGKGAKGGADEGGGASKEKKGGTAVKVCMRELVTRRKRKKNCSESI